jgi:hypothetical protein
MELPHSVRLRREEEGLGSLVHNISPRESVHASFSLLPLQRNRFEYRWLSLILLYFHKLFL